MIPAAALPICTPMILPDRSSATLIRSSPARSRITLLASAYGIENSTFSARSLVIVMAETMTSNFLAYSAGMMPFHAVSTSCAFTPSLPTKCSMMSGS